MGQVIKLGILGSETTLTDVSRMFPTSGNNITSIEGRSADATLHTDFIANKRTFTLSYSTISEANKDIITNIYLLQISTPTFLNFIYTNEASANVSVTVKMSPPVFGSLIPKSEFWYGGTTILLEEV